MYICIQAGWDLASEGVFDAIRLLLLKCNFVQMSQMSSLDGVDVGQVRIVDRETAECLVERLRQGERHEPSVKHSLAKKCTEEPEAF